MPGELALPEQVEQALALPNQGRIQTQLRAMEAFQQTVRQLFKPDHDYGVIPGTGGKPTLLKPGAEKIAKMLNAAPRYNVTAREIWTSEPPFFDYDVECVLYSIGTEIVLCAGVGNCNSWETKYKYRYQKPVCPTCGHDLSPGREDYGGGWFCGRRDGGCGASFKAGTPQCDQIDLEPRGQVINMETASQKNTILKMAKKRALVDAVLGFATLSEVFTQDLEDIDPENIVEGSVNRPASNRPAAQPNQQQGRRSGGNRQGQASSVPKGQQCPIHNRPWGATPDGEIGHPLGDGQWCIKSAVDESISDTDTQSEQPTNPEAGADEREQLETHLLDLGWTWDEFETVVLSMPWSEYVQLGGNHDKALEALTKYMDNL